jgi:D-aminopeptidase
MISRERAFDIYMDSYDQSADAIVAIGMHAGAGNEAGFLSHTYTVEDTQYKVNGIPFNESMILAMGAARYRIPLIMVSGDDRLQQEIARFLPWVKYAAVKRAVNRSTAEPFTREEVSRRIESAAREALSGLADMRVADITPPPFRFALTFQDEQQAQSVASLRGAEPASDPATIQIRAGDFEEGYRRSLEMIRAARLVGRAQALQRAMNAQPNGEALSRAVSQHVDDRWLNLLPPPTPPAGAAAPQRYWGAR